MYPSNLVEPIDLLCNLGANYVHFRQFCGLQVFAMLLVVFLLYVGKRQPMTMQKPISQEIV